MERILLIGILLVYLTPPSIFSENIIINVNSVQFYHQSRKIAEYRYNEVPYKPYIKQLFTPSGLQILEDAPPDHLHHHGIMFAVAVNNINFWEESEKSGKQVHKKFIDIIVPPSNMIYENLFGFRESIEWISPQNDILLVEERTIACGFIPELEANCIVWSSNLKNQTQPASIQLSGNHYFGLGMRVLKTPLEKVEIFCEKEENIENVRGDEYLRNAKWCCLAVKHDKGPFTILFIDMNSSTRFPSRWFTMRSPFVYISSTRNLWKLPLEITTNNSKTFSHVVLVWDGCKTKEEIVKVMQNINF